MRKMAIVALAALAGCGQQPAGQMPDGKPFAPLPEKVCAQAKAGLAQLKGKVGIEISGPAEAIVEQGVWLGMGASGHDQLAQLLAYDAACAQATPPREQEIRIRNESGVVLMRRVVETGVDLSQFLD